MGPHKNLSTKRRVPRLCLKNTVKPVASGQPNPDFAETVLFFTTIRVELWPIAALCVTVLHVFVWAIPILIQPIPLL